MNAMRTKSPRWRTRKSVESKVRGHRGRQSTTKTKMTNPLQGAYQWTCAAVAPEQEPCQSELGLPSHTELWCDTHTPLRSCALPSTGPWMSRQSLTELQKQRSRHLLQGPPPRPADLPQQESDSLRESHLQRSWVQKHKDHSLSQRFQQHTQVFITLTLTYLKTLKPPDTRWPHLGYWGYYRLFYKQIYYPLMKTVRCSWKLRKMAEYGP